MSDSADSLLTLRRDVDPTASFPEQARWAKRLQRLLPDLADLRPLRVAILGEGTLGHFAETLRLWLALEGLRAEIHLAPYGAFRQEILDADSALYAFEPEIIWLFSTSRDLSVSIEPGANRAACDGVADAAVAEYQTLWRHLRSHSRASILQNNAEADSVRVFGHHEGAVTWSRAGLIRRFNLALSEACEAADVAIFDLDHVAASFGLARWHERRHWFQSKQPFAPDAFGTVAFQAARYIGALKGTARKCLVLDLDNTLWGGVVGDDGVAGISLGDDADGEAFVAFQTYLKSLANRGILLAVCSKNDETVAREPFQSHPAMRLRLDDIVVFRANWKSKVDNLREIATVLNLGLDALVLVDDNPAERELVRSHLPEVAVPEMPADPAEYIETLAAAHYFEPVSFSQTDAVRTSLYQVNAQREAARLETTDVSSFLRELAMEAECGTVSAMRLPRMAQLLARTNQFHPTTTRHSQAELSTLASAPGAWVRWFSLRDRFGDHGLVSVVVMLRTGDVMTIETWAMSCRVFSRGLEDLVFLEMLKFARTTGVRYLVGSYHPTAKNRPVAGLYHRLGFTEETTSAEGTRWRLDLATPVPEPSPFIRLHVGSSQPAAHSV